jgi:hypothetical protein
MMEFIENIRVTLVKWHVAPLAVLIFLSWITHRLVDRLINMPEGTDVATYTVYAGLVGMVLTAMFASFRLLLTGIKKEADNDQP